MTPTPTWKQITEVCKAAGLDMQAWEDDLHDRLLEYILQRTKTQLRYHQDAAFHAQITRLIGLVIGCITEHSPLVDPLLRTQAARLDELFAEGLQEGRDERTR